MFLILFRELTPVAGYTAGNNQWTVHRHSEGTLASAGGQQIP